MAPRSGLRIAGTPVDPYAGVRSTGDNYDPTEFYVEGRDRHGHDDNRRVRLNPTITAEVSRLIASGALAGTPIGNVNDFIRDAMVHRMHFIAQMVKDQHFTEAAEDARRLARADSMVREQKAKAKIIQDADDSFEMSAVAQDWEVVQSLLDLYEPMVERLRAPYSGQLEVILKRARQRLVQRAK